MSEKMTCPGCDSHTSSVFTAYCNGESCPYCDLPHEAFKMINDARKNSVSKQIIVEYTESKRKAVELEKENRLLKAKLSSIEIEVSRDLSDYVSPW